MPPYPVQDRTNFIVPVRPDVIKIFVVHNTSPKGRLTGFFKKSKLGDSPMMRLSPLHLSDNMSCMNIGIIGAGAMGSLFGGKLSSAGHNVVLYDINQAHIDAVNNLGLRIEDAATGKETTVRLQASSDPACLSRVDTAVIFVKSTATASAAGRFADILPAGSVIITLQNGYGNEDILKRLYGPERTAAGVTSHGATFLGPGLIRHAGKGPTYVCMSSKKREPLRNFVEALSEAGFETGIEDDIQNLIWSKLVINVGINALTALTGMLNGQLLRFDGTRKVMEALVAEAVEVTKARGIRLTYSDPLKQVMETAEKTAMNRSSMLQDFDRKTVSEIEFINGAIMAEAEKLRIAVPVNSAVTALIRALDEKHETERNTIA
ncbi:MAG: 2-dehydropantoate 2-reductase [Spirochaetales bacterium]|nr:MAG: 2-dehydropantoate 2-reductase [Spirochaetales bacterium]